MPTEPLPPALREALATQDPSVVRRRLEQGVYGEHHAAAVRAWLRSHQGTRDRRGTDRVRSLVLRHLPIPGTGAKRSRLVLWAAVAFVLIELVSLVIAALAP